MSCTEQVEVQAGTHACCCQERRHRPAAATGLGRRPPLPSHAGCLQGSSAGVGSVIKCGEEDDPIGVSTVLSLRRHADAKPLRQLHDFLLAAAGDEHRQRLEKVRCRLASLGPAPGVVALVLSKGCFAQGVHH